LKILELDLSKLKFNKGFALLGIMAIVLILVESYYDFGEVNSTLLTIGIVWATLYGLLKAKLF
jgi:hypothetical protein